MNNPTIQVRVAEKQEKVISKTGKIKRVMRFEYMELSHY